MKAVPIRPWILTVALLAACTEPGGEPPPDNALMDIGDVLAGGDAAGFEKAVEPREFRFPDDHAAHPGFRTEWWYLTGNLGDERGRHYGYQVTFFRNALAPPGAGEPNPSAWADRQVWMAHAALTDIDNGKHYAVERFSRAGPGLAGARLHPLRVWLHNWSLTGSADAFPWKLDVDEEAFSLELALQTGRPPALHGDKGLSRKGAEPGNASYYYSYTRLETRGTIRIGGREAAVTGSSWFDREWSTSALEEGQTGWDWFALQFDGGGELMYYRLRDENGGTHPASQGSRISPDGARRPIAREDMELTELEYWQSESGRRYPVRWRLRYRPENTTWVVKAAVDDQLMDLSFRYWEGAVEVYDGAGETLLGRGYLEMTRR